jgi:hypothetical protein
MSKIMRKRVYHNRARGFNSEIIAAFAAPAAIASE